MRELLAEIERAVRARGWSARQASIEAVGTPDLISNMRRGKIPAVDRVQALCEALGLEFYVGRPREAVPIDEDRLAAAVETVESALGGDAGTLDAAAKARLVTAVYALVGPGGRAANADRVRELIRVARGGRADAAPSGGP